VQSAFSKFAGGFLPTPSGGSDDWRGDALAIPDLNSDLLRDCILSMDSALPNGRPESTRILIQNSATKRLEDKTTELLGGVLPAGDAGHAKFILSQDVDRDGDADIILCTPTGAGTGNRMTRFLLNSGKNEATGLPILVDASSLLPSYASDPGNAVSVVAADIDGDGDNDLIVTDTHQTGGTPVKRTRIWRQDR
jgi:hypothetical protein